MVNEIDRATLNLPALPPNERAAWQARLDRLNHACGCAEGAVGLIVGLVAALVLAIAQPGGIRATSWRDVGCGALIVVVAAIAGKCLGLWRARNERRRIAAELNELIRSRGPSS